MTTATKTSMSFLSTLTQCLVLLTKENEGLTIGGTDWKEDEQAEAGRVSRI